MVAARSRSAFLHYGPLHLALNMVSLYFAGSILEQVIGRWRFLLLYLVSGLAGAAGALLWSPNALTAGASGAIFGDPRRALRARAARIISTGGQVAGLLVLNLSSRSPTRARSRAAATSAG